MSWDIVSKAAETVITNAIIGITKLVPLLPLSPGPDTEGDGPENGGGGDAPTAPEVPGQPSPTPPPPAPPVPPEGAEGPAAEAAKEEARRVGEMLEQLVELDSAGISAEEVAAAGEVGRQELEDIRAEVLSPARLNAFVARLKALGCFVTVRKSRGRDVQAACGQLIREESRHQ